MYPEVTSKEKTVRAMMGWYWLREKHGCLFDRGSADSYYGRRPSPHYGGVGGESGARVEVTDPLEVAEYMEGYRYNEQFGDKKDWR